VPDDTKEIAMTARQDMKNYLNYIAAAGFNVRMMKDGALEVQDPYMLNGKANAGFEIVTLKTPRQANRFIMDRS